MRLRPDSEAALKPYTDAAAHAIRNFDLAETERQYRAALTCAEALDPPDAIAVASVLYDLASLHEVDRQMAPVALKLNHGYWPPNITFVEAEEMRRRAKAITEGVAGPDSPAVAEQLVARAFTLTMEQRYREAEDTLRQAEALYEKSPEAGQAGRAAVLLQMGMNYRSQGRLSEARESLEHAIAVREAQVPPAPKDTGMALTALANVCMDERRYREAEALCRKALSLLESAPDADQIRRFTLRTLALSLRRQWRPAAALRAHWRFLALERTRWKEDGIGTVLTMLFAHTLLFLFPMDEARAIRRNREEGLTLYKD